MNIVAYWAVLSSQRKVVVIGVLVSVLLAFLALVRPTTSGLELRSPRTYVADSTLVVTQSGFPWGRTALDEYLVPRGAREGASPVPRFAEPGRMEYLTALYAELAMSDVVRKSLDPSGRAGLEYEVVPVSSDAGGVLPFITVAAFGKSPEAAIALSNRVGGALRKYIAQNQDANKIPEKTRVEIGVAAAADNAEVFEGIRLTPALMIGILGLTLTVLIAFMRHNVQLGRQQQGSLEEEEETPYSAEMPERQVAVAGASRATTRQSRHVAVAAAGPEGPVGDEARRTGRPAERWKPRT